MKEEYFSGPGLKRFNPKLVARGLQMFNRDLATKREVQGETGIKGLRMDMLNGLRLKFPRGNWHVIIRDGAGVIYVDRDIEDVTLISMEKYLIEWDIEIYRAGVLVFKHRYNPRGLTVHFVLAQPLLGDNLVLINYVDLFRRAFHCRVTCSVPPHFVPILSNFFSELVYNIGIPHDAYACYYLAGFMNLLVSSSADIRLMPMELFGQAILPSPRVRWKGLKHFAPSAPPPVEGEYVCIAVQASYNPKCWLNPTGWDEIVTYLKQAGYRVLCIDKYGERSNYGMTVRKPKGAEDFTGDYSLLERINQLAYAKMFIGVSSGLSWLARAAGTPTIVISGITDYWYEGAEVYRVINPNVCHGCFNSLAVDPLKILDCPRYNGTDRQYECSKNISAKQVKDAIDQVIADGRG